MLILHENSFVFIHNPKTAGMSIIHALIGKNYPPNPMSHLHSEVIIDRIFQSKWAEMESVCLVRDPVDRYYSLYNFHRSINYGIISHNSFSHQIAVRYTFEEWVEFNLRSDIKSVWFGIPQDRWWSRVKFVLPFEDIGSSISKISEVIGRPINVPHINQTGKKEKLEDLPVNLLDGIWKIDTETARRFGYM